MDRRSLLLSAVFAVAAFIIPEKAEARLNGGLRVSAQLLKSRIKLLALKCDLQKARTRSNGSKSAYRARRRAQAQTRGALLAYGIMRGVPSRKIERNTTSGNAPDAEWLQQLVVYYGGADFNRNSVSQWLDAV